MFTTLFADNMREQKSLAHFIACLEEIVVLETILSNVVNVDTESA